MHIFGHGRGGVQNLTLGVQTRGEMGLVELPLSPTKRQKDTDALPLAPLITPSGTSTELVGHVIEEGHTVELKPLSQNILAGLEEDHKFLLLLIKG